MLGCFSESWTTVGSRGCFRTFNVSCYGHKRSKVSPVCHLRASTRLTVAGTASLSAPAER